jgi:hypothetical protein
VCEFLRARGMTFGVLCDLRSGAQFYMLDGISDAPATQLLSVYENDTAVIYTAMMWLTDLQPSTYYQV